MSKKLISPETTALNEAMDNNTITKNDAADEMTKLCGRAERKSKKMLKEAERFMAERKLNQKKQTSL